MKEDKKLLVMACGKGCCMLIYIILFFLVLSGHITPVGTEGMSIGKGILVGVFVLGVFLIYLELDFRIEKAIEEEKVSR